MDTSLSVPRGSERAFGWRAYRFFRCCGEPRHFKVPLTIMANRLQSPWHSSIECDVNKTLRDSLTAFKTAFHKVRRALGSMPLDGSSLTKSTTRSINLNSTESFHVGIPGKRREDFQSVTQPSIICACCLRSRCRRSGPCTESSSAFPSYRSRPKGPRARAVTSLFSIFVCHRDRVVGHLIHFWWRDAAKASEELQVFHSRQQRQEGVLLRAIAQILSSPLQVGQNAVPAHEGVAFRHGFVAGQHLRMREKHLPQSKESSSFGMITLKVVDFPAPLTPSKPKHSPFRTPNEIWLTAGLLFRW